MDAVKKLLRIEDLRVWFGSLKEPVRAVDGVSFSIDEGSTVALVGESGCGKSVTALSLARLIPVPPGIYAGGRVFIGDEDIMSVPGKRLADIRGKIVSYVFQEPGACLNPVFKVGRQIEEAVRLHGKNVNPREEALKFMKMVGLPEPEARYHSYPHEMSGGMQQRVMIAMALACYPEILVADEPTTALDVTIQAQILELLKRLQRELKMTVLLITHNLGLVADIASAIHVMYAGRIVESGDTEDVLVKPAHPYTVGLLEAVPRLSTERKKLQGIDGTVPSPSKLPPGCKFAPRCRKAQAVCTGTEPDLKAIGDAGSGRCVRCYFPC